MSGLGLIRRRELWVPTIRGFLLLVVLVLSIVSLLIHLVYPFLAVRDPVETEVLVVEGWLPDMALRKALEEFREGRYRLLVTTGEELQAGSFLSPFRSYAELAAETLKRIGAPTDSVIAVPVSRVKRDRTEASAVALQRWLQASGTRIESFNLVTLGAHARRSRSVFQSVVGDSVRVGVIPVRDEGFDPEGWWRTSRGVNVMMDETVGYLYWALVGRW